jgi:hypothetical protein
LVNFYTKIWSKFISKTAPAKHFQAEPPEAMRRPRHALPEPLAPRRAPCPRTSIPRCRTCVHAADRRSVGGAAAVRAPPEPRSTAGHLRRHPPSSTDTPSRIYKPVAPPLRATPSRTAAIAAAAWSSCFHSRSPSASCSSSSLRHP